MEILCVSTVTILLVGLAYYMGYRRGYRWGRQDGWNGYGRFLDNIDWELKDLDDD